MKRVDSNVGEVYSTTGYFFYRSFPRGAKMPLSLSRSRSRREEGSEGSEGSKPPNQTYEETHTSQACPDARRDHCKFNDKLTYEVWAHWRRFGRTLRLLNT
jgi:hypothetical protein